MLAAALALTNCVDQFETPIQESDIIVDETTTLQGEGEPFEVFVETAETKLDYDGNVYSWSTAIDKNGNKQEPDKIFLYSVASSGASTSLQAHNEFTYIGGGKFVGNLAKDYTLPDENNWYGVYGYSSSAPTVTIGVIEEGSYTQKQMSNNSKRHLAGSGYPMYGVKKNVPKNKSPKFSMSHLSAIIALEIVNNGAGGNIVIKDAQIEATEEIVGDFTVVLLGASAPTFTKGSDVSKIARVELTNAATVTYGNSATLYLAVKPFDASNKDLTISVNGSTRTVTMPANTVFRAGTVTTLRVPVNALEKETASDAAFNVKTKGRVTNDGTGAEVTAITTTGKQQTVVVNGKEVKAYKLCGDSNNTITVTGFLPGLFTKLPVGFFATGWNDEPSVMTVTNVKAWLPEFYTDESKTRLEYTDNRSWGVGTTYKKELYSIEQDFNQILGRNNKMTISLFWGLTSMDITLDISRAMMTMLGDGVKSKITFSGMPPVGYFTGSSSADDTNTSHNVITLNEDYAHKSINETNIDGFIKQLSKNASYEGLKQILTATEDKGLPMTYSNKLIIETTTEYKWALDSGTASVTTTPYENDYSWPVLFQQNYPEAVKTAEAIYKLLSTKNMDFAGIAKVSLAGDGGLIPNKVALIHFLRDMKVALTLGTMGETEESETNTTAVIWGLDVNAEE